MRAIRAAVVWQAKRDQQCNRLRNAQQPFTGVVIRVYDAAGNVIETHEHKDDFVKW